MRSYCRSSVAPSFAVFALTNVRVVSRFYGSGITRADVLGGLPSSCEDSLDVYICGRSTSTADLTRAGVLALDHLTRGVTARTRAVSADQVACSRMAPGRRSCAHILRTQFLRFTLIKAGGTQSRTLLASSCHWTPSRSGWTFGQRNPGQPHQLSRYVGAAQRSQPALVTLCSI